MTGKLMKYELRGCMRIFLPLWAAVLVLSAINGFTMGNQATVTGFWPRMILFALPAIVLWMLLVGMFVVSLVIIVRRFYNGLLGEGGYFAFSLPATTAQQIVARLLTSCIMLFGCLIAAFLSGLIIFSIQAGNPIFSEMKGFLKMAVNTLKSYPRIGLLLFEMIVIFLLYLAESVLRLYSAIAVGHLSASHRGWLSVAAYLVMGMIISYVVGKAGINIFSNSDFFLSAEGVAENLHNVSVASGFVIAALVIENVILWFITHIILNKKLNIL